MLYIQVGIKRKQVIRTKTCECKLEDNGGLQEKCMLRS